MLTFFMLLSRIMLRVFSREFITYGPDVALCYYFILKALSIHFTNAAAAAKSLQSCPILCDPTDGSPPGSPVPGILQARTLQGLPVPSPMHESEK